jgi:hypothetical protein
MIIQPHWQEFCDKFTKLQKKDKVGLLGMLLWAITLTARATYEPGTNDVLHPQSLRKLAELAHRIAQFQLDILNLKDRRTDQDFFEYVSAELTELGCSKQVFDLVEKGQW